MKEHTRNPVDCRSGTLFFSWQLACLSGLLAVVRPGAAQTKLRLSDVKPGTERVQLINNGDFLFQGPLTDGAFPFPTGWSRSGDMFVGAGSNMVSVNSGVVARGHVDGGAQVSLYQRIVNLEPNTVYYLSGYLWNMGDSANHVNTVVDLNDAPSEAQLAVFSSDSQAANGYFVYQSFNTANTGTNITLRVFYDGFTGTGTSAAYYPLGAQWDNIAITRAESFAAPQASGSTATLRPLVRITSPADGIEVDAFGASLPITADATDLDGTITNVQFFAGTNMIGEVSAAPWTVLWSNVASGAYVLTAVAADNTGATTLSAPVSVSVVSLPISAPLYTAASSFAASNHYVAASVFVWFAATSGQLSGPWRPLEGRSNWTGLPNWWQGQIKQMMMANIDVLYVHLYNDPNTDQIRVNLFNALNQLRAQGYNTPKIAPFLDPVITWDQQPLVDLATTTGKDTFVGQYIRFFNEYYSVNTDAFADDYLARQANKPILDTWHVKFNCTNLNSLTRADVSNRLVAALGAAHPCFTNGFVQVATALNPPTLSFADEEVPQFEITAYNYPVTYHSVGSVQLKGGYWDQNIRSPGSFLARAGGVNYSNAWSLVTRAVTRRVYLESWNEYDEGSGIYAVTNLPPYIAPANTSGNTDVWSTTGDPFEYIRTTARGAAGFNDTPLQSAKILWHNLPTYLAPGQTRVVTVIVRNSGNASWTAGGNYKLGQADSDTASFVPGNRVLLDDSGDEIPIYGGIFRGRPKMFTFTIEAPQTSGVYTTHWQMLQENVAWFGEALAATINVSPLAKPQLTIRLSGASVILTWPTNVAGFDYTGFTLQSTTNLDSPTTWVTNSPAPVVINGQNTVTNPISSARTFYRLVR
jgi:hypothetical protein